MCQSVFTGRLHGDEELHNRVKDAAKAGIISSLKIADNHLKDREYLIDQICIADIYLTVILRWCKLLKIRFTDLPNLQSYYERVSAFEPFKEALAHEGIK
ncbi:Glutathione S-transferase GstA [Oligella ureolytica]|uniref:glutathione binding-like protein n=1 Tax=Oligella ureolytica TaxID=90244 RepID=UPI000DFD17D3|nr:glutathione binding-like protein [Oligella ureolytica]SUA57335.1 Glutathione S-transferase GstA [Oligella ureolytica]